MQWHAARGTKNERGRGSTDNGKWHCASLRPRTCVLRAQALAAHVKRCTSSPPPHIFTISSPLSASALYAPIRAANTVFLCEQAIHLGHHGGHSPRQRNHQVLPGPSREVIPPNRSLGLTLSCCACSRKLALAHCVPRQSSSTTTGCRDQQT